MRGGYPSCWFFSFAFHNPGLDPDSHVELFRYELSSVIVELGLRPFEKCHFGLEDRCASVGDRENLENICYKS